MYFFFLINALTKYPWSILIFLVEKELIYMTLHQLAKWRLGIGIVGIDKIIADASHYRLSLSITFYLIYK